ncbi:MAG: amidase [Proteobacteria bacterium]|nr:amidase [Pseudomonadota bacterium]
MASGSSNCDRLSRREFFGAAAAAAAAVSLPAAGNAFEYAGFDATGLANLVRRKEVSPLELLEYAIERVEAVNPKLNAVVAKSYDMARASIGRGVGRGPFAGVPFLLKDLGASLSGVPMTMGSRLFVDYAPDYNNELVNRYQAAGLVIIGRTNTPEFGLNGTTESAFLGACRNPWDLTRSSGGSSGGSAAAVATRVVPMAHGSDGGGSIRLPSSCCGVFGMKPSRGRQPTGPEFGEAWEGLVSDHAMTLSIRDSARLLDATSAPEQGAPYGIAAPERPFEIEARTEPPSLRIALCEHAGERRPDAACTEAVRDAAGLCEELGHTVEEAAPELEYEALQAAFSLIMSSHSAAMLDRFAENFSREVVFEAIEPATLNWARAGWQASAADLAQSKDVINRGTRSMAAFLSGYDVLLTPTAGTEPPPLGHLDTVSLPFEEFQQRFFEFIQFTWPHNLSGLPAMSVPLYWNPAGLPIGVQFVGRHADEATLFRLAGQLERARPWRGKFPAIVS